MTKLALHDLWSRKRRLVGMFSAILIGVAFLAGTLVLGDTMRSGFGTLFAEANAGTDAVVRSSTRLSSDMIDQQGSLDSSLVDAARAGSTAWPTPRCRSRASARSRDATASRSAGTAPRRSPGNWIDERVVEPVAAGRGPGAAPSR